MREIDTTTRYRVHSHPPFFILFFVFVFFEATCITVGSSQMQRRPLSAVHAARIRAAFSHEQLHYMCGPRGGGRVQRRVSRSRSRGHISARVYEGSDSVQVPLRGCEMQGSTAVLVALF